jgi:hypothetical protein
LEIFVSYWLKFEKSIGATDYGIRATDYGIRTIGYGIRATCCSDRRKFNQNEVMEFHKLNLYYAII